MSKMTIKEQIYHLNKMREELWREILEIRSRCPHERWSNGIGTDFQGNVLLEYCEECGEERWKSVPSMSFVCKYNCPHCGRHVALNNNNCSICGRVILYVRS